MTNRYYHGLADVQGATADSDLRWLASGSLLCALGAGGSTTNVATVRLAAGVALARVDAIGGGSGVSEEYVVSTQPG